MGSLIARVGTFLVVMVIVGITRGGRVGDFLFGALLGAMAAGGVGAATKANNTGQNSISANVPIAAAPTAAPAAGEPVPTSKPAAAQGDMVYCSVCGTSNPTWRWECETCHARLAQPDQQAAIARSRPGCVSAFAILLGISAGLIGLGGLAVGVVQIGQPGNAGAGLAISAIAITISVLYGLLARGMWHLKNRARIVVIVIQGIGVAVNVLAACTALGTSSRTTSGAAMLGTLVGLVINGAIIYWFASHGEYFD